MTRPVDAWAVDRVKRLIASAIQVAEVGGFGYAMQHKSGGDRGFSWNADDPLFSGEWQRIELRSIQ